MILLMEFIFDALTLQGQSFTIKGKIVADATLVAVLGPTILSLKTDDNSGGTHFRIRLCNA